jgi:hypothetical protein
MNVDHIYQLQRDDAFAAQFSAPHYQTFVAMPFSNRGGYPEPRIKKKLLNQVHMRANALLAATPGKRTFAPLHRVDGNGQAGGSVVITDQIVTDILACHFFVGDLTGCNFGVVLEAGVGLALKPNERVLLFTQDDTASLHFDLKVTKINHYKEGTLVAKVAQALVGAAAKFEAEADRYIRLLSSQLTPDAIIVLNFYGQLWKGWQPGNYQPSIYEEKMAGDVLHFRGPDARIAFQQAIRELLQRRLFWTHYSPNSGVGIDSFGLHATKLGWRVIEHLWQHDDQMREPSGSVTGPNH